VVLFTPGEEAADQYTGYLTNRTITGLYAQEVKGAVVMLERKFLLIQMKYNTADLRWIIDRYWGDSSPYLELTTENLQQLTLENSIADLTYFAKNVELPFDTNGSSNAQNAVWVLF
jgi:hypothetical protein